MIPGDLVFWSSTKIVAQVGLDGWLSDEIKKKKAVSSGNNIIL